MTKKDFDFRISKVKLSGSFTMIPNSLVLDLMHFISHNELKLLLYIYQKDNEFSFNKNVIAEKFSIHKKNIDKVFLALEKKGILYKTKDGYSVNLMVDTSEMKVRKINQKIKKIEKKPKKPIKKLPSSKPLSEVKHTSGEVRITPPFSGSEVKDIPSIEVKHTSQPNLTTTIFDEALRKEKSSNNTNNNNTNSDIYIRDNYINKENIEVNSNSLIEKPELIKITPQSGFKNDSKESEELNIKNENHTPNSIEFLIKNDPKLAEEFKGVNCDPSEFLKYRDGYLALVALAYMLKDDLHWKEVNKNLKFNWKYLGIPLFSSKSALWLQLSEGIKNNLAEEIIAQSKLSEEELIEIFLKS